MSNNKQSIKLYTEEQVRTIIGKAQMLNWDDEFLFSEDYLISSETPIELPSDEEIDNKLDSIDKYHIMKDFYCDGFKDCAKYIIDKIQGGNNEY